MLICAPPGKGKSALVLALALKMKVPSLYMSADSDAFTQVSRALSVVTGTHMDESEKFARSEEMAETPEFKAALAGIPIRFNFLASPALTDMERATEAFEELYGEYPALIVIDNITNVQNGNQDNDGDPFSGLEGFLEYAHTMARETQSCVVGLHHVNAAYNDGTTPIPMSGVKGQIGRIPEMILTLFQPHPGTMGVSPVKIRGGPHDATGSDFAELEFDGSTMTIQDPDHSAQFEYRTTKEEDPFAVQRRREEEMA